MINERYELAKERLFEIEKEEVIPMPYRDYFREVAQFLGEICKTYEEIRDGKYFTKSEHELAEANEKMYEDVN